MINRTFMVLHPNHRLIFRVYGRNYPIAHQKMAQRHTMMRNQSQIIGLFLHLTKDNFLFNSIRELPVILQNFRRQFLKIILLNCAMNIVYKRMGPGASRPVLQDHK